ncbi:MAG: IPT/TIG domain-containing protein [Acidobacteria bacterium]|nr:IPT/TIG domain-containing protein [Acidobacteriota bacterium]
MRSASKADASGYHAASINYSLLSLLAGKHLRMRLGFLATFVLLTPMLFGEGTPRVTGIDPAEGKVNETATVAGENLGKDSIAAVLLSDDKADFKATIVEQAADKIAIKVPDVKPGDYNVSIQVGNNIFIQPVRFKVNE